MPQYDFQIADYERIFRKRYKIVIASVILGLVFSVLIGRMKRPVYTSTATVKVDRSSVMGIGMEALFYGTWDNVETQAKVITSFPVLLRAAKSLELISPDVSEDIYPSDEKILSILEGLRGRVAAATSSGTNIIKVSATSMEPHEARNLANALAFAYKDYSLDQKKLHASKTSEFVTQQLDQCRSELAQAEYAVQHFEEVQEVPSIDANSKRIIELSSQLQEKLGRIDDAIGVIRAQGRRLAERHRKQDFASTQGGTFHTPELDSLKLESGMGWVSEFTDNDPGLRQINSRLIQLQITLDDLLSHYRRDHPSVKEVEKKIDETIVQILAEYKRKLAGLKSERDRIATEKARIDGQMNQLPANEMQYARLMRSLTVKEQLYTMLMQKQQEAMIAEAGVVEDVTIMSMAVVPNSPTNKNITRFAGVGLFLGLIFGIILAIVREMFDTSIGTIEDVERALKLPVLAVIPHINPDEVKRRSSRHRSGTSVPPEGLRHFLVTHFNPKDPTAEAYRILRTNFEYLSHNAPIQTLLVTSATMQEGKSTTITNLAIAFAQQGKKVLLLECNLRRPSHLKIFGFDKAPGTSDILIEKMPWRQCVRTVTDLALGDFSMEEILAIPGLDNLNCITYGHRPPNPTELLASDKMKELLSELRQNYDIVLIDAPPLLPVADSMVLSTRVDAVALVYKVGKAPRNSLQLAKERLETVHANLLGVILNDIRPETTGLTYSSYYMYAYGKDQSSEQKPQAKRVKFHTKAS